jgi:Zn-dependent protease
MPFGLSPATILARLVVLLFGFPVHEWAHAWSADQLGDDTPRWQGRLSLNPMAHLDILGSIMLLLTGFGWAKPVPVSPHRMRTSPRAGMALTALAGPASNLLVAMLCAVPFRLGWLNTADIFAGTGLLWPELLLWRIAEVSLGLALFNLLPLFPLDGEKVLAGIVPRDWGDRLLSFRPYSPYVLMGLIALGVAGRLIQIVWWPLLQLLFWL